MMNEWSEKGIGHELSPPHMRDLPLFGLLALGGNALSLDLVGHVLEGAAGGDLGLELHPLPGKRS